MATTTFSTPCPVGEWTLLADGDTYASGGFQAVGSAPCKIAVAASAPDPATNAWLLLDPIGITTILPLTIGTGNKVYGQGLNATGYVRGYLTAI
jgi:hypothetical protein